MASGTEEVLRWQRGNEGREASLGPPTGSAVLSCVLRQSQLLVRVGLPDKAGARLSGKTTMKKRINHELKDECRSVIEELESLKMELSDRIERSADRLIGKTKGWSVSVSAGSG